MATITFDTLKFANKLKSVGVLPEHAEAEPGSPPQNQPQQKPSNPTPAWMVFY